MITWMQRHKKYLIVTIWISTIAFIGAGFVGWGQYSYGDKAGAIAKVGEIEITQGELQKTYSNLYGRYNEMFQGNFDEEKAKQFGLQKQAFAQLEQQALILNLAASYDLEVNDAEVLANLKTQEYFFKDGVFDKEVYKQALSRSNLTTKEYENEIKKNLLITKTLQLLPLNVLDSEKNILTTLMNIADKINYKILDNKDVTVDASDELVKNFWSTKKENFMSEITYDIEYIKQKPITKTYEASKINSYYAENKTHFRDDEGKVIPLENAKDKIISELNQDATKKEALRTYIAYKKAKLDNTVTPNQETISMTKNIFNQDILQKVSRLSVTLPYMKPVLINGEYVIIKLINKNPAKAKSFEDAKTEVTALYKTQMSKTALLKLANDSFKTFKGKTTDFITTADLDKIEGLSEDETKDFMGKLFVSKKKNSFITLNSGKIVLYDILEQKMLTNKQDIQDSSIANLKTNIFNEALIKKLQKIYKTETFVKGL